MTAPLKKIPLFGEGVYGKSSVVTRQRRLNCYLEVRKDGDKSTIVCYGTPGLALAFTLTAGGGSYPLRGMIGNATGFYAVQGSQLLSLLSSGTVLAQASIGSTSGQVGMALNPTQVMIVDGSAGWCYTPSTGVMVQAPAAFPNGALTVCYCNGFFICELPGTNEFFVSNLNDGTTWNGLSYATAVQSVDGVKACDTLGGLLIIFSTGHCEFWQNVGATPEPFQYITNSASNYGLAAVNGRVHAGDSILFLANSNGGSFQNATGNVQICRIRGYQVSVVSTTDIDYILQQMARTSIVSDCTAYSYLQDEHLFCQFNFPTANRSLLYDVTSGLWSEVQSGVTTNYAARHLGNVAAGAYNQTFVGDYSNGNVYTYSPTQYTDNGNVILRELVTRCALEDFNTFRVAQIYLDMDTGVGLQNQGAQGYAPVVSLEVARDNRNFGVARYFALGAHGQFWTRVNTRRWGRAKQFTLRIRVTDPVKFVITAGAARINSRAAQRNAA